ncbi:MAG: dienelactone hydrolase family protein [Proteobacteria bacterium]|nr:dienelactone hydrolase family protein [Pseudomonadota bacterium]
MYDIHTVRVQDSPMEIFLYEPEGNGPHPGIVLAQHIPVGHTGIENDAFTLKTAERYAENGYAVAVPFIFHWWPKEAGIEIKRAEFRDDWTVLDLEACYDFLASREHVDGARIGIVGHCWGGRVAWLGACHNRGYRACAIFYGGRIKLPMGPNTPPAIDLAGKINCAVAGFFGNEDENPSPADVDDYEAALAAAKVPHVFQRYDHAGHGFQSFANKERFHPQASEDAWGKVLAFLQENLA